MYRKYVSISEWVKKLNEEVVEKVNQKWIKKLFLKRMDENVFEKVSATQNF